MTSGRHAVDSTAGFAKDITVMIFLFLAAGVLAYGVFWWLFSRGDAGIAVTTTIGFSTQATQVAPPTTVAVVTTVTEPTTTTTLTGPRAPSEVRVLVLNSTEVSGVAAALAETLDAAGYETLVPGNYLGEVETSKIWFRAGFNAEALEIGQYIPDATPELNPDISAEADVVVVIGPTYQR